MRNLKKVLALALAVVMLVGMMVVGAGAASYKDTVDNDNAVAIEVVSAIKALEGSNGNFRPDGKLTRADGAVIAARVALTRETANKLVGASGVYSDVSAKHYASGAIAWATNEGYLSGDGSGAFRPNGSLYGIHFAKMLLCVLGYDAEIEGFTGKDYVQKITLAAAQAGLLDGIQDVELNGKITRGQAAVMAFNALNAREVEYDGGSNITIGDVTIVAGAKRSYVYNDETKTLGSEKYDLEQITYVAAGLNKVPATIWTMDDEPIEGTVEAVAPAMTITKATKLETLEDAGYTVTATLNNDIEGLSGNGVTLQLYVNADKEIYTVIQSYEQLVQVENVKTDREGNVVAIELTCGTYVAATEDTEATPGFATLVEMGVEEEDLVLVNVIKAPNAAGNALTTAYAVIGEFEMVAGVASKKNATSIVLGGTELKYAANAQTGFAAVTLGESCYAILDTNGFVLMAAEIDPEEAPAPNYMIVTETWSVAPASTKDKTTYHFTGVTMAGEVVTGQYVAEIVDDGDKTTDPENPTYDVSSNLTIVTVTGGTTSTYTVTYPTANVKNRTLMVEYTIDEDTGVYTLADDHGLTTKNADILAGAVELDGEFFASDVQFVYLKNYRGRVAPSVKTGLQVIDANNDKGEATTGNASYYVFTTEDALSNEIITRIFVLGAPAYVAPAAEYVDGIYYIGNVSDTFNYYTVVEDGEDLITLGNVTAFVDGEKTSLDFVVEEVAAGQYALEDAITAGFYKVEIDELGAAEVTPAGTALKNADNSAAVTTIADGSILGNVKYANGEYYVVVGGVYYNASNALVLDLTLDAENVTLRDLLNSSNAAGAEVGDVETLTATMLRNSTATDTSIIAIVVTGFSVVAE